MACVCDIVLPPPALLPIFPPRGSFLATSPPRRHINSTPLLLLSALSPNLGSLPAPPNLSHLIACAVSTRARYLTLPRRLSSCSAVILRSDEARAPSLCLSSSLHDSAPPRPRSGNTQHDPVDLENPGRLTSSRHAFPRASILGSTAPAPELPRRPVGFASQATLLRTHATRSHPRWPSRRRRFTSPHRSLAPPVPWTDAASRPVRSDWVRRRRSQRSALITRSVTEGGSPKGSDVTR